MTLHTLNTTPPVTSETLEAAIDAAWRMIAEDPVAGTESARLLVAEAQRNGFRRLEARAGITLAEALRSRNRWPEALDALEPGIEYYRDRRDHAEYGKALMVLGAIQSATGKLREARSTYESAERRFKRAGRHDDATKMRYRMAVLDVNDGRYDDALANTLTALKVYREHELSDGMGVCHMLLGIIYDRMGDAESSEQNFLVAIDIKRKHRLTGHMGDALANLGAMYAKHGMFDKAIDTLANACDAYRATDDAVGEGNALNSLAAAQIDSGDFQTGLDTLRRAEALLDSSGEVRYIGTTYANMAEVLLLLGRTAEGARYVAKARAVAERTGNRLLGYTLHALESRIHEADGEFELAFQAYRQYVSLREEAIGAEKQAELARIRRTHELERIERLIADERRMAESLEEEIRMKTGELRAVALQLVQKTELLEKLLEQVDRDGALEPSARESFRARIHAELNAPNRFEQFHAKFAYVHPEFRAGLSSRFPTMTPAEIDVCCLLRVNCSSKEIASILHLSPATVDLHRSRIRRKAGLGRNDSLVDALARI